MPHESWTFRATTLLFFRWMVSVQTKVTIQCRRNIDAVQTKVTSSADEILK